MKIVVVPHINGTPARTNRKTGVIYISKSHFDKIDTISRLFILYHEAAHYLFQTKDEDLCDEFATQLLLKQGYRLKKIFYSINANLTNSNSHYARKVNILNLLRIHDYLTNNNINVLKNFKNENI